MNMCRMVGINVSTHRYMVIGCERVVCIDWRAHTTLKPTKNSTFEPTFWAKTKKCQLWPPKGFLPLIFFRWNFIYIILGYRWVDLDTYIGQMTHLKKWSFFHRTNPYHESRLCILRQMRSHWGCASPDSRFLSCSYVLAIALSWAFWDSWSICCVCSIATLRAVTSTLVETVSREPAASWRFFNASNRLATALASILHFLGSPFWLMIRRTTMMCARYSLLFPRE